MLSPQPSGPVYMGVDWGGNRDATSVCILTSTADGQLDVQHRHLAENAIVDQINSINNIIAEYKPKVVVTDIGFGQAQTAMLQERHGNMVMSCYYGSGRPNRFHFDARTNVLTVDRDAFLRESSQLRGGLDENDRHSLNYAYIGWSIKNTRERQ